PNRPAPPPRPPFDPAGCRWRPPRPRPPPPRRHEDPGSVLRRVRGRGVRRGGQAQRRARPALVTRRPQNGRRTTDRESPVVLQPGDRAYHWPLRRDRAVATDVRDGRRW